MTHTAYTDTAHLERAVELAAHARAAGNDPFGAGAARVHEGYWT